MPQSYHTTDLEGESLINPDAAAMRAVLESLEEVSGFDFPDVSLVHASGWAVTVTEGWGAVLERVPDDGTPPATLALSGLPAALKLWQRLAAGDVGGVLALPWQREED